MWNVNSDGTITSALNSQCLDVWRAEGPMVQTYPCHDAPNQLFSLNHTDNTIRINLKPNLCLGLSHVVPVGQQEVWAAPMANGDMAVILFNRAAETARITAFFADIGLTSVNAAVRDLWAHASLGPYSNQFSATLDSHAVQFLRFTPL